MNLRDELGLIAELGVAFAGFVSIFLIFARAEGRFSPADSLRVRSIILASMSAVFMALLPLVLIHAGVTDGSLWRSASLAALVIGLLPEIIPTSFPFFANASLLLPHAETYSKSFVFSGK